MKVQNTDVIRSIGTAIYPEGALAVLKGNLAPARLRHQAIGLRAASEEALRPRHRLR